MSDPIIIRVIDFETTGLAPPEDVIEVGTCDLVQQPNDWWSVRRPQADYYSTDRHITPENRAVHHIDPHDLVDLDRYDPVAFAEASDHAVALAAHNMAFENQWLGLDGIMPLICTYKAALRVWPTAPGHSNQVLRYWLAERRLLDLVPQWASPPHRAGPDAYVTAHILKALLEAGATISEMALWTFEPPHLPTCPIGKWKGTRWDQIEAGYLRWMTGHPDMSQDLRWNAARELERRAAQ